MPGRNGEVHEVKVQIIDAQILQAVQAGFPDVAVIRIPQLRRYEEILALDRAAGEGLVQCLPNLCLVTVISCQDNKR